MSKKILFIEDEKFLRNLISKYLKENGYNVKETASAEEGLELLKKEKFDLILLDILLPKIDGFQFLSQIKKDPQKKEIPVIILSNYRCEKDIEKGLKLGAVDYLVKPEIELNEIIKKIKEILK